ncbi:MAG TPA: GAF domain-containing protein [Candidatus Limnocylindria bacterium]|nr:GAF domain-containing protein [Candidatus Limnocylindria bacterium]
MWGVFPRDPLLIGRLGACVGAVAWLVLGGQGILPVAAAALALLVATSIAVWRLDRRRGHALALNEVPPYVVLADLVTVGVWMVGSSTNPRSIAFVIVLAIGAFAMYRLGRAGLLATMVTYLAARVGMEAIRVSMGESTPVPQLVAEVIVVGLAVLIVSATVDSYRAEQARAARALRLGRSLERVATEIASETEPMALFRSIARSALLLADAHHATINVRRGEEFYVAAGAGTGERVVGVHAPAQVGIVGAVLRSRATVTVDDYADEPTAVPAMLDVGIHALVGVPIFLHGEFAATITVGRLDRRPFDLDDRSTLEGLAAHAAIALRNARIIEQGRRLEALSRQVSGAMPEDVIERIAQEAKAAFDLEWVFVAEMRDGEARPLAALGAAAPLRGLSWAPMGPLLREAVASRELVVLRDYATERPPEQGRPITTLAHTAGIHATMVAPIVIEGEVRAALSVATTDAYRTFDVIERQGLTAFAELAGTALRAANERSERERRIGRLSALNVLAWQLAAVHEPFTIAKLAFEAAGTLVQRDSFAIARYDEKAQELDFVLFARADEAGPGEERVALGMDAPSQVVLSGEQRRTATEVHVPMKSRGRLVGVLTAGSAQANALDDEDVAVLQTLANLVATAFENAEALGRMRELYLASVRALAAAVDARDPYTRSHSARVSALARSIGEEMELSTDQVRRVQLGALLHDIGKIGVPDAILNKPGALTDDEWIIMRTHSILGASIVNAVEPLRDLVPIVRAHHERYDGDGYPDELGGDLVPIEAYVVAAADAFEVIVSRRSYKPAQTVEFACAELLRCRGTQFHPAVVDAFLRLIERDRAQGAAQLRRIAGILHEDIEDVPGPGVLLEQFAASAQTHGRQLAILQRLASEISAVLDIDELAGRLLRIVCDAMGYENGFLLTLDSSADHLVIRAAVGPSGSYVGQRLPRGQGISWWVVEHGELQNVPDGEIDPRFYGPAEIRSVLCVPLQLGDERIGVLGVESPRVAAFGREDEDLLAAVSHQVAAAVRVAKLHQAAKTAAATDPLTGLPNRRSFFERLAAELVRQDGQPLAVAILDANGLKALNDELGHAAGDEALVKVGEVLQAGVRDGDLVARIGGDEFAVLFAGTPFLTAERVMRRLAERIARGTLATGQRLPTIAWGIADASGETSVDALVDAADRAMYRQKQLARKRIVA